MSSTTPSSPTPSSTTPSSPRLRYRLLTGPDTSEFCERVSKALNDGYKLYGSPTMTFDPEEATTIVAQAIILPDDQA